jgi:acyl carrier protein
MDITPQAIIETIGEEAGIAPEKLIPEATLASLDIASLDMVSALFSIEDKFGVDVQPEDAAGATTLQELVDIVMRKAASV